MNRAWLILLSWVIGGACVALAANHFYHPLLVMFTRLDELAHAGVPAIWAIALLWQVARTAALEANGTKKNNEK
jgi:hypothetical protein